MRCVAEDAKPEDFRRPGYISLLAKKNGVLERNGHTEATVDLCRLAGFVNRPCCEIAKEDGTMMHPAVKGTGERMEYQIYHYQRSSGVQKSPRTAGGAGDYNENAYKSGEFTAYDINRSNVVNIT